MAPAKSGQREVGTSWYRSGPKSALFPGLFALLYSNTVRPRMRLLGKAKRAYWRWRDLFDRDWDIRRLRFPSLLRTIRVRRIYTGSPKPNTLNRSKIATKT